jgi:uncharacterized membrane protein YfcA
MTVLIYILLGFVAEMIDGTMGMAYGVSASTFLRAAGVPSAAASASVHAAEIFTTLVSGISHIKLKNVSRTLFLRLVIPGAIGGVLGAYILSRFQITAVDIAIDVYLIVMGVVIFVKAFSKDRHEREAGAAVSALGFVGGLSDAMGGGGWGPVVTSTLLASGHDTRKTIGTVNTAEFFVTVAETTAFAALLGDFRQHASIIIGLIIGGVIAAPIGAAICSKIPKKPMLICVGVLVSALNVWKLLGHAGLL